MLNQYLILEDSHECHYDAELGVDISPKNLDGLILQLQDSDSSESLTYKLVNPQKPAVSIATLYIYRGQHD